MYKLLHFENSLKTWNHINNFIVFVSLYVLKESEGNIPQHIVYGYGYADSTPSSINRKFLIKLEM